MWRPNRHQWAVIWVTVILAFLIWLDAISGGDTVDELFGFYFLSGREEEEAAKAFAVFILVAGGLLLWMLEGRKANRTPPK